MTEIAERVKKIVLDHFGVKEADIAEGTKIIEDLGADSLDRLELMMMLEEEFELEIPEGPADEAETIEDVVNLIEENLKKLKKN